MKRSHDTFVKILLMIIGIIIGNIAYLRIFRYWVFYFWGEPDRNIYISIIVLSVVLLCEFMIWIEFKLIYKKTPKFLVEFFFVTYIVFLAVCLIGPNQMELGPGDMEFNILSSVKLLSLYELTYIIGVEVLAFIPIGMFCAIKIEHIHMIYMIGSFATISVICEVLQYTVSNGIFKLLDITLYMIGMIFGYGLQKIKSKN